MYDIVVSTMDRHELAHAVASHWVRVLGRPLTGKQVSIRFEADGDLPDAWTIAAWKLPYQTRDMLPKAVAHLLRNGRRLPEAEVREAVLKNAFDSIQITIFQVPERTNIPKWVEEEYFVRGILHALLLLKYPDWDRRQLRDYEKKLIGPKDRNLGTLLRIPLYVCAVILIVFAINFTVFLALGHLPDNMTSMYIAFTWESIGLMLFGLMFTRVQDIPVYGPAGRFHEIVRYPPRLTAAVTFITSGLVLLILGLLLLS